MDQAIVQPFPGQFKLIEQATIDSGFTMASDPLTGSILRTLAATKPGGMFLELGTGSGLSTSWILDGMDLFSRLVSIDHDEAFLGIARRFLGDDQRLQLICNDGATWMAEQGHEQYDFIFADTWHGKYLLLDEALAMLKKGGIYIIDDMLPQPNWPEGHSEKALKLLDQLDKKDDVFLTKQIWSTGIVIVVKR